MITLRDNYKYAIEFIFTIIYGAKNQKIITQKFLFLKKQNSVIIHLTFAPKTSKDTTKRMESPESHEASKSTETAQAEFNALILRHKALIWHICSDYNLGNAWNTEDCFQEVMVSLWRSFGTFEGRSSEKTWVWRVATNTMLMLKRKAVLNPQTEPIETEGVDKKSSEQPGNDSYQQLQQLIEALPIESGIVIRAFLDGFSYKEIAKMTDSSVGAVAMRIARTKRRLRTMYERENNS